MNAVKFPFRMGFDAVESVLNFMVNQTHPLEKNQFYTNEYAPVTKEVIVPAEELKVVGRIPSDLSGEFVRNGPNPKFRPAAHYHWFDGDGMLHGVRVKDGKCTYVNHWVRTRRLQDEERLGRAEYIKIGDMHGPLGLAKLMVRKLRNALGLGNITEVPLDSGTNNTAVVFHAGKMMALVENALPYVVKVAMDGRLETQAAHSYAGKLQHPFTAHPKVDARTGEMFFFGYSVEKRPYITYSWVSAGGELQHSMEIPIPDPVMMHDFAITEHFAIFFDLPLVFKKELIVKGFPFHFDKSKKARFGVLPRYAKDVSEMRWFESAPFFGFHSANAFEEGDDVVLHLCRMGEVTLEFSNDKAVPNFVIYEWRFNMRTGAVQEKSLTPKHLAEFPRIHPALTGYKNRFIYAAAYADEAPKFGPFTGVCKLDLQKPEDHPDRVVYRPWGKDLFGAECVFVPREPKDEKEVLEEDDGYLLGFVHNGQRGTTQFVVLDAKNILAEPLASVEIPHRVPLGFHGLWVSEKELAAQH